MKWFYVLARWITQSNKFVAGQSVITVFVLYFFVNLIESSIERVIWGDPFWHILDYPISAFFAVLLGYVITDCYLENKADNEAEK